MSEHRCAESLNSTEDSQGCSPLTCVLKNQLCFNIKKKKEKRKKRKKKRIKQGACPGGEYRQRELGERQVGGKNPGLLGRTGETGKAG